MISEPLIVIAFCILAYGIFSEPLSRSVISAPMAFMLVGLGAYSIGAVSIDVENEILEGFGELTLGLILFADAASTDSRRLLRENSIPMRLLVIALPVMIALGGGLAVWIFPSLSWQEAFLIGAILAPTDAALGIAVVTSKYVPERIRQAILVESGLNDGLALPAVLFFAALAFGSSGGDAQGVGYWLNFTLQQVLIGAASGAVMGAGLGKLVHEALGKNWINHSFQNLTSIGVAILIMLLSEAIGGNGFIAAFVSGLFYGGFRNIRAGSFTNFVEEEGQLFSLVIFFFFGAALLPEALDHFTVFCVFYALMSLTVIRMAPTWLALLGKGLRVPTTAFIGWFGPRGLASILFLFIAVDHEQAASISQIEAIIYVTVFLSVILHGASAAGLSKTYGASTAAAKDG